MSVISAKLIARVAVPATMAFTLMLVASSGVSAQPAGHDPNKPLRAGGKQVPTQQLPSIRERQFRVLEMERELVKARTPEEERLAIEQIAEDFERIQVINNKMMSASMRAAAPDYGNIADTTAEIRRRANRMKENLRLPKLDPGESTKMPEYQKAMDVRGMKAALLSLDGSIMSFIKSPIFKNPDVVNLEQATKAERDLETIIQFSQLINKDAERLSKSAEKSN